MNTPQNKRTIMNNVHEKTGMAEGSDEIKDLGGVKEYRCPVCRRLLMKGKIIFIETRCPKCKRISVIREP